MRARHLMAQPRGEEPLGADSAAGETWRAVIAALRLKGLPSMRERADALEQRLEQHRPDQPVVTLHLTDDLFLRAGASLWLLGRSVRIFGRGPIARGVPPLLFHVVRPVPLNHHKR
jgi:hypothetical protein